MIFSNIKNIGRCIAISLVIGTTGCSKDYKNPNAAPEEEVFTSARGMTSVAIGLQRTYSFSRTSTVYNMVTANGFVTNELIILNTGNLPEAQLNTGGVTVDGTNTILANIWANANKIILDANRVIAASANLGDKGYASGLVGYVTIYKALALGSMSMYWEQVPDTVGTNVSFNDRMQGFNRAIASIDGALSAIAANPISPSFAGNIPAGTDILNTLHALKARYALFSGNYALALAAANAVDLTKRSTMAFDAVSINPMFETVTSTNNVLQPVDSTFGLPVALRPTTADKRVQFYTTINPTIAPRFRAAGFSAASTTPWPYYLPGEMTLIKAEALVRQANPDLANAVVEIDKIRTKRAAADPFGIGADETAYSGPVTAADLLTEIYSQRCIELFMSGLKLEDMRRFARPTTERKRNFFPYPFRERDNNSNTPKDPVF
ncbi:RagB/SusD family nutrient uptake outer membrane protein [Segetibacter sp. 3557_3]|uniref:RagB/SusD family nutrient uptake outer membrane protein n=1 Tax=Segetibacter sp. 3557_3 TaxID=2547429 RepID=UPI0010585FB3|nr:RagB/SusD family nutrient uptake outer membrane protein [Segetibacter sp. 3557_3]TDH27958.1 RagB/SusD family nutrient uptake outer membrane protein [Segetibacter sp. 3557_3]